MLPDETTERMSQTWGTAEELEPIQHGKHGSGRSYHVTWGGRPISFRIIRFDPRHPLIELIDGEEFLSLNLTEQLFLLAYVGSVEREPK